MARKRLQIDINAIDNLLERACDECIAVQDAARGADLVLCASAELESLRNLMIRLARDAADAAVKLRAVVDIARNSERNRAPGGVKP